MAIRVRFTTFSLDVLTISIYRRWDDLEQVLTQADQTRSDLSGNGAVPYLVSHDKENLFQMRLGKLILFFHQRDGFNFIKISNQAKLEVRQFFVFHNFFIFVLY